MVGYDRTDLQRPQTAEDYYHRRTRRRRPPRWYLDDVDTIFSRQRISYQLLRAEHGDAASCDGIRLRDLTMHDVGRIADAYSWAIRCGAWRPYPGRSVRVAKPGKPGQYRELRIGSAVDRAVSRTLLHALTPYLESALTPVCYARPGRGSWHLLAELAYHAERDDMWVVVCDDVVNAYDSTPIEQVMAAHERLLDGRAFARMPRASKQKLLEIIRRIVTGGESDRTVGLSQGDPYSGAALDLLLHYVHDAPLTAEVAACHAYRYVDDLTYLAGSDADGCHAWHQAQCLLRTVPYGTHAAESTPIDLAAGHEVPLLGIVAKRTGRRLSYSLGNEPWDTSARFQSCTSRQEPMYPANWPLCKARHTVVVDPTVLAIATAKAKLQLKGVAAFECSRTGTDNVSWSPV